MKFYQIIICSDLGNEWILAILLAEFAKRFATRFTTFFRWNFVEISMGLLIGLSPI